MSRVAVINAGSSSLKFKLFDMDTKEVLDSYIIENIGEKGAEFQNHHEALKSIDVDFSTLNVVGHRVVHGGEEFNKATLITEKVLQSIQNLTPLAPLHNPSNVEGIRVAQKAAPNIPQVAVFDTAFHTTMPKEAYLYALSLEMYEKHGIRRYGFHGTSHSYVSKEAAKLLQKELHEVNLITLHLGNGASVCAIKNGKSVDTSMGFTPLEGLVMGTRCGDIDPAIVLYMLRELGMSSDEVDRELNRESGLKGLCGENDFRAILKSDEDSTKLATDIMVRRIQKYIGSYMALLGRVDAVVFTGGIGENSAYIRERVMSSAFLKSLNLLVIKTDEELEIANECLKVLKGNSK
jgi:acetate kinase